MVRFIEDGGREKEAGHGQRGGCHEATSPPSVGPQTCCPVDEVVSHTDTAHDVDRGVTRAGGEDSRGLEGVRFGFFRVHWWLGIGVRDVVGGSTLEYRGGLSYFHELKWPGVPTSQVS